MTAQPAHAVVSVIVPCRNEAGYIGACLDSVLASEYPADMMEVLVVDGRSDDGTRAVLDEYARRDPRIRILDNARRTTAVALNIGIRAARGPILVRLDAHVVYPANYIGELVGALETSGADNVGAVIDTLPANDSTIARAIAAAISHPFGVGNAYFRIGVQEPRWVDTVPFFCCRRELFDRVGCFDEELLGSEDDEFNGRVVLRGGRHLLLPGVVSKYYARDSLRKVARMYYQYGYFKPVAARKLGRVLTGRQLVPPAFVLALGGSAILGLWLQPARLLSAAVVAVYLCAVGAFAIAGARRRTVRDVGALALVFAVIHCSYGFGFLRQLARFALPASRRPQPAEVPLSR